MYLSFVDGRHDNVQNCIDKEFAYLIYMNPRTHIVREITFLLMNSLWPARGVRT